jgi:hypothetical protein
MNTGESTIQKLLSYNCMQIVFQPSALPRNSFPGIGLPAHPKTVHQLPGSGGLFLHDISHAALVFRL